MRWWLVLALLAGCTKSGDDTDTGATGDDTDTHGPIDADSDGWPGQNDCDDANPDVHPGATEVCNGFDDDCDGTADDQPTDGTTFYEDADHDGFGTSASSVVACSQPGGYAATSDDCDDGDPSAYPGATEICDGSDDDCDGKADDGAVDATTWYADADGDGYGDANKPTVACTAPIGQTADDSDCDDTRASVSPDGEETCNGRDDDCDGTVDDNASDATVWYADADGDGQAPTGAATTTACSEPSGYASATGDCDDTKAGVYTGAPELCDGSQNDCASTSWTASDEDEHVSYFPTSGLPSDVSSSFPTTAGTPSVYKLPKAGTIVLCDGTYYAALDASSASSAVVQSATGATGTVLNGNGSAPVLTVSDPSANVLIDGLTFTKGSSTGTGGAVQVSDGVVKLRRVVVSASKADTGGGIGVTGGTVSLDSTQVTTSTATDGGAIAVTGGTLKATSSELRSSTATDAGGGLYVGSAGTAELTSSIVSGDKAAYGAGIATDGGAVTMSGSSSIDKNTATSDGGGLWASSGTVDLTSVAVAGNFAAGDGGGAWLESAALTCTGATGTAAGFTADTGDAGGGVYLSTGATFDATLCDFGTTGSDNFADDVYVAPLSTAYASYGDDETFSCDDVSGCL